ncbi:hypothetical protein P3X46_010209 [Hevea brasiliensis]|uniref:Pentacotripeptide-repeat region of PRORP domain-containing protein n=1 Tax=Hevea brasiliensis TaxID=3981 RepID=A0ABQ9MH70_HEVBR|nr:pentatricopeptide repeat-containing protein At4g38150-like [Hevea brasiliensis]KAJ9178315.1 hypothetical protein P3X46_010209 [Hevea brasiliensis]
MIWSYSFIVWWISCVYKFKFITDTNENNILIIMRGKITNIPNKIFRPAIPSTKKPVIGEPDDPKDLQFILHKMLSEGLINNAIKMFDALSKVGLTHEALELFSQIKDKSHMPDVAAHTAVIEVYANAGRSKEAPKVFLRMLACGVAPNAYTYTVPAKAVATDGKLADAKKYIWEMISKGIRPNVGTYTAVFQA